MLNELLLVAFVSLSLRTANVPDNPTDYQYMGGYKTETTEVSGYRERENGIIYDGFNYKKNTPFYYSKIVYKEAQDIDSQTFAIKCPIKNWGIGAGLNSQKWDHGRAMVMLQYSDGIVDVSYQLANNRQIIDSKVSEQIPLKGNFYLEPLATYHYEIIEKNKKDFWQAKLLLGYKFSQ